MTKRRAVLTKPKQAAAVFEALIAGERHAEIGRRFKVSRQAVTHFAHRHKAELEAAAAQVVEQTIDIAIRSKVERLRAADVARTKVLEYIDTYGLVQTVEHHGEESYTETKFSRAPVQALVELQRYAAEELGDMPRQGINIDNRKQTAILVFNPEDIIGLERPDVIS